MIQPEYGRADAGREGRTCLVRPDSQARRGTGEFQLTTSRIANGFVVPLTFPSQIAHVPGWQLRILLGMVETRSITVNTHTERGYVQFNKYTHIYTHDQYAASGME